MDTFPLSCSHHGGKNPEVSFPKRMTHTKSPPPLERIAAGKTVSQGGQANKYSDTEHPDSLDPLGARAPLWKDLREQFVPAFGQPSAEYVLSLR